MDPDVLRIFVLEDSSRSFSAGHNPNHNLEAVQSGLTHVKWTRSKKKKKLSLTKALTPPKPDKPLSTLLELSVGGGEGHFKTSPTLSDNGLTMDTATIAVH